ncbi:hypothetical protein D9M71_163950 [compost metagenome]
MQRQRQHPRKRPEADCRNKHQGQNQFVDAADHIEQLPRTGVEPAIAVQVSRGQKCQRYREHDAQQGSPQGDLQGFHRRLQQLGQDAHVRGQRAQDEIADLRQAVVQLAPAQLRAFGAPLQDAQGDQQYNARQQPAAGSLGGFHDPLMPVHALLRLACSACTVGVLSKASRLPAAG